MHHMNSMGQIPNQPSQAARVIPLKRGQTLKRFTKLTSKVALGTIDDNFEYETGSDFFIEEKPGTCTDLWPELQEKKKNQIRVGKTSASKVFFVKEHTSFFDQVNLDTVQQRLKESERKVLKWKAKDA